MAGGTRPVDGLEPRSRVVVGLYWNEFCHNWTVELNRSCFSTMYQIFLIQILFLSAPTEWSLIFVVSRSKLLWVLNPKGLKNSQLSPKGLTTFKIWDRKLWLLLITKMQKFSVLLCLIWNYYYKKKIFCINLSLSDAWIWMNFKVDLCVNQDLFSSITLYPLQQFWKFLHIRNQQ